jgi:hypothetical protein
MDYELPYAGGYFRVEMPIGICEKCKELVDGIYTEDSADGMGGGYGTAYFTHQHELVFLILEWEDRYLAGPRYYYIDGEPTQIHQILEKAGQLWKRGYGFLAVKDYLQKSLSKAFGVAE